MADKDMDYISDKGIMTYDVAYNILYGKKKLFSLDNSMVGYDLFLKKLEEKKFQNFKEL